MAKPLEGITVFDMTLAGVGPFATMELAGMGADVIKFEAPAGDIQHRIPPKQRGFGIMYAHFNLGKRSVVLDFKRSEERERALAVLERADVYIQNMRPGVAARLGFGYDDVRAINPSIVYVDSSAWGSRGPMGRDSGADGPVQAFSAFTSLNGQAGGAGEFIRAYGFIDLNTSQVVALSVLDGLLRRQRTGKSQFVESTMLGASLLMQRTRVAEYFATGDVPPRRGSAAQFVVPDQAFLCLDNSYVTVSVTSDAQWQRMVSALGDDSLTDGRFATNPGRVAHREELIGLLDAIFRSRPVRWWEVLLGRNGVPVARPLDYVGVVHHPQVRANAMIQTIDTAQAGAMDFAAYPWRFGGHALPLLQPASTGGDTEEVLAQFAATPPTGPRGDLGAEAIERTLEGIRVVDLTAGVCGPFAGMLLAELGADVTKVEPPEGDPAADWGPPDLAGVAPAYADLNRRKTVERVDVVDASGRDRLEELIAGADIVLDDDEAALLSRAGIDRSTLTSRHPRLIHCTVTGFGEEGPLAGAPASELVVQAMATTFLGFGRLGDPPVRMGADSASANSGMHAAQGVLAALLRRYRTGAGERISVNMLHSALHMRGTTWTANKDPDDWVGHPVDHPTQPPASGYRTRDLPVFFIFGKMSDEEYEKLMVDFGMEDCLDDPRFANQAELAVGSRVHAPEVRHLWERTTSTMTSQEVIDFIVSRGGEVQRLNDYSTLFVHPQIEAIDAVQQLPDGGRALKLPWSARSEH